MYRTNRIGQHGKAATNPNNAGNPSSDHDPVFQEHKQRTSWLDDQTLLVRAAAKINLTLSVGPLRSDGYHMFESLMAGITLYDDILIRPGRDSINLTCDDPSLPVGPDNLVHRACSLLAGQADTDANVDIELIKRIPTQAGLGGGSADAAGTVLGLNEVWGLHWSKPDLSKLAAMLGSDVPFFLNGPLAVCSGRGEIVTPVDLSWDFWAVIVKPRTSLSTAEVYRHCQVPEDREFARAEALVKMLPGSKPSDIYPYLFNDLEASAFQIKRELGDLRDGLQRLLNVPVKLSGSGSAMFALFDTKNEAHSAMTRIQLFDKELTCWLVKNSAW